MDRREYKILSEEITSLIANEQFAEAAEIADQIDWRKVRSFSTLMKISELYQLNRRYEDALELMLMAYDRNPKNRSIVYSLCELYILLNNQIKALEFLGLFKRLAPKDAGSYILQYKIQEMQGASIEDQIALLEEYVRIEYKEEWVYQLAYLYHRIGLGTKCVETCSDMIAWFGDGPFVIKAMELKMLHARLKPDEQAVYDRREHIANEIHAYESDEYTTESPEPGLNPDNDDVDWHVKTIDMSKFNTINLQKALAESMRELMTDKEQARNNRITGRIMKPMMDDDYMSTAELEEQMEGYETEPLESEPEDEMYLGEEPAGDDERTMFIPQGGYAEQAYPIEMEDGYTEGEYPEEDGYAEGEYPEEDGYAEGEYPEEDGYAEGEYPEEDGYAEGEYPEEDGYAEGEYPEEDGYAEGEYPEEDGYAEGEYPEEDGYAEGEYPEEDSYIGESADTEGGSAAEETGAGEEAYTEDGVFFEETAAENTEEPAPYERAEQDIVVTDAAVSQNSIVLGTGDLSEIRIADLSPEKPAAMAEREEAPAASEEGPEEVFFEDKTSDIVIDSLPSGTNPEYKSMQRMAESVRDEERLEKQEKAKEIPADVEVRRKRPAKNAFEDMLYTAPDGQIGLAVPQSQSVEKQITGQIEINDYLAEWEDKKRRKSEAQKQALEKKLNDSTGPIFAGFDERSRNGLIEEMERQQKLFADKYRADDIEFRNVDEVLEENRKKPAAAEAEEKVPEQAEEHINLLHRSDTGKVFAKGKSIWEEVDEAIKADQEMSETRTGLVDAAVYAANDLVDTVSAEAESEDPSRDDTRGYEEGFFEGEDAEEEEEVKAETGSETEEKPEEVSGAETQEEPAPSDEQPKDSAPEAVLPEERGGSAEEKETADGNAAMIPDAKEPADKETAEVPAGEDSEREEAAEEYSGGEEYPEEEYEGEEYPEEEYDGEEYPEEEYDGEEYPEGEYDGEEYPEGEYDGEEYPEGEYDGEEYPEGEYDGEEYPEGEYEGEEYPEGEYDGEEYPEGEYDGEEYPEGEQADYQQYDDDAYLEAVLKRDERSDTQDLPTGLDTAQLEEISGALEADADRVGVETVNENEDVYVGDEDGQGLSVEEQELFSEFMYSKKMYAQILDAVNQISLAPYMGNAIVTGEADYGVETLGKALVKEIQMIDENFLSDKIARISGNKMNRKNITSMFSQLGNGALLVDKASDMSKETLETIGKTLDGMQDGLFVILMDTKKNMDSLLEKYEMITGYFNARIDIQPMSNNALVDYAKKYAYGREYKIDEERGVLALHQRISERQIGEHNVTPAEIEELVDAAIEHSSKAHISAFFQILGGKRYDYEDMIILREKDFQ